MAIQERDSREVALDAAVRLVASGQVARGAEAEDKVLRLLTIFDAYLSGGIERAYLELNRQRAR